VLLEILETVLSIPDASGTAQLQHQLIALEELLDNENPNKIVLHWRGATFKDMLLFKLMLDANGTRSSVEANSHH